MTTAPGTLYQYSVFCINESAAVFSDFQTSAPTTCPNNNTHTIDSSQTTIVASEGPVLTAINQESTFPNGGFFRVNYFALTGAAGTATTMDITYPYNVDCYSTTLLPTSSNLGDNLQVTSIPNTVVGTITSGIGTGSTGLNSTGAIYVSNGFYFSITDGTNTDNLGEVISFNVISGNINFSQATVHSFGTGAAIMIGIPRIKGMTFVNTNPITLGLSKIGSSGLPAGNVLSIIYTNNGVSETILNFYAEIGY